MKVTTKPNGSPPVPATASSGISLLKHRLDLRDSPRAITLLENRKGLPATKRWTLKPDGSVQVGSVKLSAMLKSYVAPVNSIEDVHVVLSEASENPCMFMIRGKVKQRFAHMEWTRRKKLEGEGDFPAAFEELPIHLLTIDLDDVPVPKGWEADPETAVTEAARKYLPATFHNAAFCYDLSASAGSGTKNGLNVHLYFYLSEPMLGTDAEKYLAANAPKWSYIDPADGKKKDKVYIDTTVCRTVQPVFFAAPVMGAGVTDPFTRRRRGLIIDERTLELVLPTPHSAIVNITGAGVNIAADAGAGLESARDGLDRFRPMTDTQVQELLDHIKLDKLDGDAAQRRKVWFESMCAVKTIYDTDPEAGFKICNEWSSRYGGYVDEAKAKQDWDSARSVQNGGKFGAGTLIHWAEALGDWKPSKAYTRDLIDGELAYATGAMEAYRYVVSMKRYVDTKRLMEYDRDQFDAVFVRLFSKGMPHDVTLRQGMITVIADMTYAPLQPVYVQEASYTSDDPVEKLNYWRPPAIKAHKGDGVQPFLDHIAYMYPEAQEADILLDFEAYNVQFPGDKILWSLLLQGLPGIGKTYCVTLPMQAALGPRNVKVIPVELLHEDFNGWQKNCSLIIVEEMMAKARVELMNKLKSQITEPWHKVREMYKPPYWIPNRFNWIFLTNCKDAIIIDETDRRYCVLASKAVRHPGGDDYYKKLFAWTKEHGPELLHYFQERSLAKFSPKAHAPITDGREMMIGESRTPLQDFSYWRCKAFEWPFNVDLVSPDEVAEKVLDKFNLRADPRAVGRAFAAMKFTQLGQRRLGEKDASGRSEKINLWAVRNEEKYLKMTVTELRTEWVSQVGGAPKPGDMINVVGATEPMSAGNLGLIHGQKKTVQ